MKIYSNEIQRLARSRGASVLRENVRRFDYDTDRAWDIPQVGSMIFEAKSDLYLLVVAVGESQRRTNTNTNTNTNTPRGANLTRTPFYGVRTVPWRWHNQGIDSPMPEPETIYELPEL